MSFDGLRTVKANNRDTALEGKLIRYGNASAQIAFATGTLETARQTPLMMGRPLLPYMPIISFPILTVT